MAEPVTWAVLVDARTCATLRELAHSSKSPVGRIKKETSGPYYD